MPEQILDRHLPLRGDECVGDLAGDGINLLDADLQLRERREKL